LSPSAPPYALMYVYGPTGTQIAANTSCYFNNPGGDCNISLLNLPSTGTYSVKLMPSGQQTMSFNFTASQNVAGTLALNTPQGVTLVPGQDTSLTFTATAGQTVAVGATSIVTTPASQAVTLAVYNASGTSVGSTTGTGSAAVNLVNLAAGTYKVVVIPNYGVSATMQVTLASGIAPTVALNGTTNSYATTVPSENAYFYFSGTAGQDVGLGVTGLTLSPSSPAYAYMYVYGPTGTQIAFNGNCYFNNPGGDCNISLLNLPSTGTYSVKLMPSGQQTMSFNFTASQNVAGTLALNTPQGVTLVPGQDTSLTFTATAGQTVAVGATSIVTTPASQAVTLAVYNASGTSVGSTTGTGSAAVNLVNLAAGTYKVVVIPNYGVSATMQVTLASGIAPTVALNGTTNSYATTVPSENAYFYFSGTAGQDVGLGVTGLTLSPSSPAYAYMYVYGPTGTQIAFNGNCYFNNPGGDCNISLLNLPSTGTYSVKLMPSGQQTMSFNFTASQNVAGTLALNTPQGVTLVPGQDTSLTFTA